MAVKVVQVANEFGPNRRAYVVDAVAAKADQAAAVVARADEGAVGEIKERFVEAMDVLRRLPCPAEYLALKGARSSLPDFARTSSELEGGEPDDNMRIRPMQREIARLDEVLAWLFWIDDPFAAKCLLARGARVPWKLLQSIDPKHRSREALRRLLNDAYHTILCRRLGQAQNSAWQGGQI